MILEIYNSDNTMITIIGYDEIVYKANIVTVYKGEEEIIKFNIMKYDYRIRRLFNEALHN